MIKNIPFIKHCYFTASFRALAALNLGAFDAAIGNGSFVAGLIPIRAGRSATSNLPNPDKSTFPPSASVFVISSNTVSTATVASFLSFPAFQLRLQPMLFI